MDSASASTSSRRHFTSLVAADALEIPNERLWLNTAAEDRAGKPELKYRDYYSVFGMADKRYLVLNLADNLDTVLRRFGPYARFGDEQPPEGLAGGVPFPELLTFTRREPRRGDWKGTCRGHPFETRGVCILRRPVKILAARWSARRGRVQRQDFEWLEVEHVALAGSHF